MKKIFILLLIILNTLSVQAATPIKFIYLNGSNANTTNDKIAFTNGMNTTHCHIKKELESSKFIQEHMLKNGEYSIEGIPVTFFWGYESQEDLKNMDDCLISMKMLSPKLAQSTRCLLSHCMHDAIWVQKSYNMRHVINNLHRYVMRAYKRGEKVILSGHSAGSFITYEYLVHKLPAIYNEDLIAGLERTENGKIDTFYRKHPQKSTCLDAITESGIAVYSAYGEFVANQDDKKLKEAYMNLDKYTDLVCAPQDEIIGVVNYGSPLALFYSDSNNSSISINRYNKEVFEYIKNNNIFFLTINFSDDPIGFPAAKNLSADEMQNLYKLNFTEESKGFVYNKSDVRSPATFVMAHSSYWKYPKKFAKAIKDGYIQGYKNFYPDECK